MVEIRAYQPHDEEGVVSLWNLAFPDDPPWNRPSLVIERKLTVQPSLFFVATDGGRVVGTVLAGFDGVRGWVHHCAVSASVRRRGIGRQLMAAAERGLAELGCPKLNLQVRATNSSVVAFYNSLGFAVEERISMGKRLDVAG